jgi:hypothetical protein
VTDLSAIQQGDHILIEFTLPSRTTENLPIRRAMEAELRIGVAAAPFQLESWVAKAKVFNDIPVETAHVRFPVATAEWTGSDVTIAVRVMNRGGRTAGWSNFVVLTVVPSILRPSDLSAKGVAEGVLLSWSGAASGYRIYRRVGEDSNGAAIAESDRTEFTDTRAEYGKTYHYSVEGFRAGGNVHALSARTPEVDITPVDTWPPPVPGGLAAVVSAGGIALVWDQSISSDLAGYRIYRAEGDGAFTKLAETREAPAYSDRSAAPGKSYRYAVSAFDQIGNESEKSAPVSVQLP